MTIAAGGEADPEPLQAEPPWWAEAVFYQVYPLSFCLADPEGRARRLATASGRDDLGEMVVGGRMGGAGDLEGVRSRLEHLVWLGVDALWLSPFQPSPLADFGYDVSDYCDVNPLLGTLDDFDRLLADAHEVGLRVIIDWVPNHTSDRHPWFVEARSSTTAPRRDWYRWRPGAPGVPPNNWRRSFGEGPAWTYDRRTASWYLHLFLPEQPDLNWSNPALRAAMEGVLAFWLDRGVDGFRVDVVHALGKDEALPDGPPELAGLPWSIQNNHESTHEILRRLRAVVDRRAHDPMLLGEVFLLDTEKVAGYYGDGDELHLGFNFPPMFCDFVADCFAERIREVETHLDPIGAWPTWVLSGHDRPRHRTRYGGSEARARAAALMLLTLRGTPCLYAGEELGLEDATIADGDRLDPGGRDGCRAPLPWDGAADHGWSLGGAAPWLPWPPLAGVRHAEGQRSDPSSILHLYRRLLAQRRRSIALRRGSQRLVSTRDGVLAYERRAGEEERLVVINFASTSTRVEAAAGRPVLVTSDPGGPFEDGDEQTVSRLCGGEVAGETALLLGARR